MQYAHPMSGLVQTASEPMGFSAITDWFKEKEEEIKQDYIDPIVGSAKDILRDAGFTEAEIEKMEADVQGSLTEDIAREKARLAQELAESIYGDQSSGGGINLQAEIDKINKNPIIASIPGGIYTVGGAGLLVLSYLVFRK